MKLWNALLIALSTYTRVPVPRADWTQENRRYALCFFPLAGIIIAAAEFVWWRLWWGRWYLLFAAGCTLIPLVITGGIHMDGLMDTADALASNGSREKKLEILKDSRCGAFAVMACAGYLLLSFALWAECREDLLFILPAFPASRALSALAAVNLRPAREDGMLRSFTDEGGRKAVTVASLLWLTLCLLLWAALAAGCGKAAVLIVPALVLAAALPVYRRLAYRDFGGVTGDLAGAFLQLTEMALLAAFVVLEAMV